MQWRDHSNLEGCHAFLGGSNYHWIRYDKEKLFDILQSRMATEKGTKMHEYAKMAIELGLKQPRSKNTLNSYINDAISYGMKPEQILWYSNNAFGTADSISFRDGLLRIHDLKTGVTPAKIEQLYVYAALFCLEYKIKPGQIKTLLRIYQMNQIYEETPDATIILPIMDKIVTFDKYIEEFKAKEET